MHLTQWTLFIDMLGYRDINGSINCDEKAQEFISFMEANKQIFGLTDSDEVRKRYEKDKIFDLYKYYEIRSCFVSDSLIITYKPKIVDEADRNDLDLTNMHSANALFIIAMRLNVLVFHCFLEKGIFLRGGISNKYCYIKDNFAVGEGLIEAYLAESKYAKNPRIILHPEVEKNTKLMDKVDFIAKNMYSGKSILQKDPADGLYFLDHIGYAIARTDITIPMIANAAKQNLSAYELTCYSVNSYIHRHSEAISKKLTELYSYLESIAPESSEAKNIESVINKFIWLKDYHNSKIAGHKYFSIHAVK